MLQYFLEKPYFFSILLLTIITSLIGFSSHDFFNKNKFSPYLVYRNPKDWHRFITAGFLHADFLHLFFNMYVFYSFGNFLNFSFQMLFDNWGNILFVTLYISAIAVSSLPTFFKQKNNYSYASIGASGAVAAILYATILIEPSAKLSVMGIPMSAILFGVIYLAAEFFMGRKNNDNINHDAHFWGALYGFVFTAICKPDLLLSFVESIKAMI